MTDDDEIMEQLQRAVVDGRISINGVRAYASGDLLGTIRALLRDGEHINQILLKDLRASYATRLP